MFGQMFKELFRQMGTGFTFVWCFFAALSLAGMGLGFYILILIIGYLRHHM